ncbi:hypothetical protein Tco_0836706 [Tanacetum coccineum]
MMESLTEENDQGDFWNNQQEWEIVRWRLYEACGVFILELKDGIVIYMLVERRYPLSRELLQQMLDLGLEVEEESTAALQLVRFIKQQLNEEHKNWLVHKQTACGKDFSNPFMVDNLPKIVWFSIHLASHASCYGNEALTSPKANAFCCKGLNVARLGCFDAAAHRACWKPIKDLSDKAVCTASFVRYRGKIVGILDLIDNSEFKNEKDETKNRRPNCRHEVRQEM